MRVNSYFLIIACCLNAYSQFLIQPKVLDSTLKANGVVFHKEFTYLAFCESGLQNKNLFGMHHPLHRKTYSVAKYGEVARFNSIEDSIKDFLIWYSLACPDAHEPFISYFKRRGYNPNPAYYQTLQAIIRRNPFNI